MTISAAPKTPFTHAPVPAPAANVSRIAKETAKAEIAEGIKEIYQEAKSNGLDVKIIRRLVSFRKQDQTKREQAQASERVQSQGGRKVWLVNRTIREKLPEGFQRAEYLLDHGMLDMVTHRKELKATLARLIAALAPATA